MYKKTFSLSVFMTSLAFLIAGCSSTTAQKSTSLFSKSETFTRQDSLRGSITPERSWWDLTYYHLNVTVNPDKKFIEGKNTVQYKVLKPHQVLQIDLQSPLKITKVIQNNKELKVVSEGNAHFIQLQDSQRQEKFNQLMFITKEILKKQLELLGMEVFLGKKIIMENILLLLLAKV